MKHNPSEKMSQLLDELERELNEIKAAISHHCSANPQLNHLRLVFGITRLNDLLFVPEEFKKRVTDLRMGYLRANNKVFGFTEKSYTL